MPSVAKTRSSGPPRLRTISTLVLLFAAVAVILWLLPLFSHHSLLFPPGPTFADITVYHGRFTLYHTAAFFRSRAYSAFAYPAGAAVVYEAFYRTGDAKQTYIILSAITSAAALLSTWLFLRRARIAILFAPLLVACAFPLVFLIQRANIEIILWILTALGLIAAWRGFAIAGAILFGLAAAMKLYPIILLGLFLSRRRDLPAFLIGLATAFVAMIASIAYAGPTFTYAARGFFTGINRFQDHYVDKLSSVEVVFDHCLFSPAKYFAYTHHLSPADWTMPYYLAAGLFALLLFLRVRTLPFLNRAVFLAAAMVCLPPVSFAYTLVHLYVPLLLLLAALATTQRPPLTALAALALLLFLMLPLAAVRLLATIPTGPLQATALLALLLITCLTTWPRTPYADAA